MALAQKLVISRSDGSHYALKNGLSQLGLRTRLKSYPQLETEGVAS